MIKVTCNGCFDGLHQGHLFFFNYCRKYGDQIIVGINDDNYIKKHKRIIPFFSEEVRKKKILETGLVNRVEIFSENNPIEFIKRESPRVHCTGEEYINRCPEEEICKKLNILLIFIPRIGDYSSSKLSFQLK